jgi:hypothetical protein
VAQNDLSNYTRNIMGHCSRLFVQAFVFLLCCASLPSHAKDYTIWIHGRGNAAGVGNHTDFSHWDAVSGPNPRAANWNGGQRIAVQNHRIRDTLDCYCTGYNWCFIAAHSAGNLQIGYALAQYGVSHRKIRDARPNSQGVCGKTSSGRTQVGWNIQFIDIAGGAAGGSELADAGDIFSSEPLVGDLRTKVARSMYDHNETRGNYFGLFAGASGNKWSWLLPGQDDGAIAYHSSGGMSGSVGRKYCNPSDFWCYDLSKGTEKAGDGRKKWANHNLQYRDDGEHYNHSGIKELMLLDIRKYAF